ncbi:MAG: hypothetical protein B7C24_10115 [Bacteroidetes bacterium 4572_77]|nr:MAG: hypothetical protein B7C24_10115 [Bacteroidetes bacterium 4572_77]
MTKGAMFVATSHDHNTHKNTLSEVMRSARLLARHSPCIERTLVASQSILKAKKQLKPLFQKILPSKYPEFDGCMGAKIQALEQSPYDTTLILDNDTLPIRDISAGFEFVGSDKHDIALSIAPNQELKDDSGITNYQNGVMFVHKNERTERLFSNWMASVKNTNVRGPTRFIFSKLLLNSPIRIYALSYLWNFRIDLLLDFNITDKTLDIILPKVRILHTHLQRKRAKQIFLKHPTHKDILKNAKVE